MNLNNINKTVQEELAKGKKREVLFQELCAKASAGQEKKIAMAIASVPIDEYREDFKRTNWALCALLFVAGIFTFISEFFFTSQNDIFVASIGVIIPFVLCYFVYRFYGAVYRPCAIWALFETLTTAIMTIAVPVTNLMLFKILVLFTVMSMSWYIARKVFPHLGIFGPKQDANGQYLI